MNNNKKIDIILYIYFGVSMCVSIAGILLTYVFKKVNIDNKKILLVGIIMLILYLVITSVLEYINKTEE